MRGPSGAFLVAAVVFFWLAFAFASRSCAPQPAPPEPPTAVVELTATPTAVPTATTRGFSVGEGVALRMQQLGDAPASDEIYLPTARGQFSLTISIRGALYVYDFENNSTQVFVPADRAP